MGRHVDPFFEMPPDEQREFIAKRLGYDPNAPATWPNDLIHELREYRRKNGGPAFAQHVKQFKLRNPEQETNHDA